ncbi:hypothetical protein [Bradyrhizobium sp. LM6.9]
MAISMGLSAEDLQRIYAVNTRGPYQMIVQRGRSSTAVLKASERPAAVVNVYSIAGINGGGSSIAYSASKGEGMPLRRRWHVGSRLPFASIPFVVATSILNPSPRGPWSRGLGRCVMPRWRKNALKVVSTTEDVAQLVCFLASPASSNMTYECLRTNGGLHLLL